MLQSKMIIASREELVYQAIKDGILRGDFKPNEALNQADIARQLGVSVIPVRSAISRLAAEGLLSQDAYHSPKVSALSRMELEEVLLIGMQLEILALRQAVSRITAEDLPPLRQLLADMDAAVEQGRMEEFGYLNRDFHMAIYAHAPLPRLRQMIRDLWNMADIHRYRAMFDLVPEMAERAQSDHARLLELIAARQSDEAVALLEAHKQYSRSCFLLAFEELNRQSL